MTGNVVFLGFALAGAPGFSIGASCTAVGLFVTGALVGGRLAFHLGSNRAGLLGAAAALQAALVAVSVVLAVVSATHVGAGTRYELIAVLAAAMGIQNAVVRRLSVPELTTTVLTMTMTGIGADGILAGGAGSRTGRRLIAIVAMFLGALVGTACVLHVRIEALLAVALGALVIVSAATLALGRGHPTWSKAQTATS
jgi:uncharacterized membrane protein YoaK (UPF0700 family)